MSGNKRTATIVVIAIITDLSSSHLRMTPSSKILRYSLILFLVLALGLLLAGIHLPLISIEKFYIFENEVSLWSGTWGLLLEGAWLLGGVLLLFSILFPISKNLLLIGLLLRSPRLERHADLIWHGLSVFGRWSMLDVFIVAVLVCSVKLGMLAQADLMIGIYCFTTSVLITNGISTWLDFRAKRPETP